MARKIKITAVQKDELEPRLYVLALLELARQIEAEERQNPAGGDIDQQEPADD